MLNFRLLRALRGGGVGVNIGFRYGTVPHSSEFRSLFLRANRLLLYTYLAIHLCGMLGAMHIALLCFNPLKAEMDISRFRQRIRTSCLK
jgi:hypothetical protein